MITYIPKGRPDYRDTLISPNGIHYAIWKERSKYHIARWCFDNPEHRAFNTIAEVKRHIYKSDERYA